MKRFHYLYTFLLILMVLTVPCFSHAADAPASDPPILARTPVLLNGEAPYVRIGNTSLTDLITDAMRDHAGADIAILDAGALETSIPAGNITQIEIDAALVSDDMLVLTVLSGREIKSLLDSVLLFSNEAFPQFSGISVVAEKYQKDDGTYAARCQSITMNGVELSDSDMFNVITTQPLFDGAHGYRFSGAMQECGQLSGAVAVYIQARAAEISGGLARDARMVTWEEAITVSETVAALNTSVPDGVSAHLLYPDTVPEAVMYALSGQNRTLTCQIAGSRTYFFTFTGTNITAPSDISLQSFVSPSLPPGRREASSIDENAIYIDLSGNGTLPSGTALSIYVGDLFAPGDSLFLYYYNLIEDISLYSDEPYVVDEAGYVTFTAASGTTFFLNPDRLDATSMFDLPRANNPFVPGIIGICALFALFTVVFLIMKHKKPRRS